MPASFTFSKYEGAGNDFILIDNREKVISDLDKEWVQRLAHRQRGVGADGIIFLENSLCADARMRIFNSDGSQPALCGNGLRCLMHFLHRLKGAKKRYQIETDREIIEGMVDGESVGFWMRGARAFHNAVKLKTSYGDQLVWRADVCVPHAVIFVSDLSGVPVQEMGREVRLHSDFQPEGVNVNFAERIAEQCYAIRTYEREVEGETLSCGTGAIALALCAMHKGEKEIEILPKSGERLFCTKEGDRLFAKGPVRLVFEGEYFNLSP